MSYAERGALLLILLLAAALRLNGVAFGLPSLNDPDEPLFMMTALEMLRNHSLNPGWFGHPATITLYCLALIDVAVAAVGMASGRFADMQALTSAVYADPGILFLPARLFIVACGVLCVFLTWRIGRQLGGTRLGLVAAALLAANAVHLQYSQIIRTDIQATVFMLLCVQSVIAIAREGKRSDYLLAGLFLGLSMATKWPAALVALAPIAAGLNRARSDPGAIRRLLLFGIAGAATLFLASPFLLLDYPTVIRDLGGEARPIHPGATGGGFLANLAWYVRHPLLMSLGPVGLALVLFGLVWAPLRNRLFAVAVLPPLLGFLIVISLQALRWERWIVPILPFLALAGAAAIGQVVDFARTRVQRPLPWLESALTLVLLAPMVATALAATAERNNDTRQTAAAWARAHIPTDRSILIEHAGFDLVQGPWRLLFPIGTAGCVDVRKVLSGHIRYSRVETLRAGSPVVDLGHVAPARIESCRADYAIFTHYDVYALDPRTFANELALYRALLAGSQEQLVLRPVPGVRSGPVVRIVRLPRRT